MIASYSAPLTPTLFPRSGGEGVGLIVGFFVMGEHKINRIFSPLPQWGRGSG